MRARSISGCARTQVCVTCRVSAKGCQRRACQRRQGGRRHAKRMQGTHMLARCTCRLQLYAQTNRTANPVAHTVQRVGSRIYCLGCRV
eukprot:3781071-Rhodomonas_salina.1